MSDIRTKAATADYRDGWERCFGRAARRRYCEDVEAELTKRLKAAAMPHEHVEPPTRVLYRCPSCGIEVWDADTGNERRCMTCTDAMRPVYFPRTDCEPITRNRGPAVESFPSSSSSLPVARCPECNRPWSE